MGSTRRIVWLNLLRNWALEDKDYDAFDVYSRRIHKIERRDGVPVGSYIYTHKDK